MGVIRRVRAAFIAAGWRVGYVDRPPLHARTSGVWRGAGSDSNTQTRRPAQSGLAAWLSGVSAALAAFALPKLLSAPRRRAPRTPHAVWPRRGGARRGGGNCWRVVTASDTDPPNAEHSEACLGQPSPDPPRPRQATGTELASIWPPGVSTRTHVDHVLMTTSRFCKAVALAVG